MFVWPTTLACQPFDETKCSLLDENSEEFDFSSLAMTSQNYEIALEPSKIVALNLCRSLVRNSFKCPYKSAVCLVEKDVKTGQETFTSLGQVSGAPYLDKHNRIVIEYKDGSVCKDISTEETHMSTKVIFK